MQVRVQENVVVRPTISPFDHDHILSLSHLDTDRNLHVTLRYLRVYSGNQHQAADPFDVVTTGLSAALVRYYPFAGTLRRRHTDGRLELHCRINDGVPVVSAYANCKLSFFDDGNLDEKFVDLLVPDPDPNEDPIRPLTLQVTRFECGGFVLGAAVHHAICDGIGATLFFNAMAELARGAERISVDPVWERATLLGSRNPARVEFPIQEFFSLDEGFSPYSGSGKRVVKEYLNVKEEWLDRIKAMLLEKSGLKFTTFEVLGALIWRAKTIAYGVPGTEKVTFAYSINIRKVVNPPLPLGYWGNGCVPMYCHLTAAELVEQPIWKIIDLIKKTKYRANDEYVRSFIDFQELHYSKGITAGKRVSGFTDWRHLGHSTVDFGWGGPVAVVPLSRHLLGSVEPCFFLLGNEGVKALVHVEEDAVPAFRKEMDLLRNQESEFQSSL